MPETNLKQMLIEKVRSYLDEKGWAYEYDEAHSFFRAKLNVKCKFGTTNSMILCKDDGIAFIYPINMVIDSNDAIRVMEFITRVNYGYERGHFQLELDYNHIDYCTFLPCDDVPTYDLIHFTLVVGLKRLEMYGDELLAVMLGMKNVRDAIEAANNKTIF